MKAGLLMALESSEARLGQIARQMLAYGRPIPLDEIVAKVDAVTVDERARRRPRADRRAAGRRSPRSGPATALKARPRSLKVSCAGRHDRTTRSLKRPWRFSAPSACNETLPAIAGAGVSCACRKAATSPNGRRLREQSRAFLTPWEPTWPADDLTRGAFRRRLKRYAEDLRSDLAYAFLIFRSDDNALVGGLTLANIRRGVAQAGSIGYWVGAPFARKGYMTAAMRALIPFCFGTLRLHRLEAACIPANAASIRLLEKTGFQREGYARGYLCINGIWQDHLLYARLKDDPD